MRASMVAGRRPRVLTVALLGAFALLTAACASPARPAGPRTRPHAAGAAPASNRTAALKKTAPASPQSIVEAFPDRSGDVWVWTGDMSGAGREAVLVSHDRGATWDDVTPSGLADQTPASAIVQLTAIDGAHAWVTVDAVAGGHRSVLATADAGRHWTALGPLPEAGCQVQFVTASTGWCVAIGAAAGSESATVYRTVDAGKSWVLESKTPTTGSGSAPGALLFGCDKNISFTGPTVGWAGFACAGGDTPLYRSADAGATWEPVQVTPALSGIDSSSSFGIPVVRGSRGAVAASIDPGRTLIYRSADAGATWTRAALPGGAHRRWLVSLVSATEWRLADGDQLLSTNDGGATWSRITMDHGFAGAWSGVGHQFVFVSPTLGFITAGGLWRTADGGRHWRRLHVPGTRLAG